MDKNKINTATVSDFTTLLKDNEELGSFWHRFGAFAVDSAIVYIIALVLKSLLLINFIDPASFLLIVIYSSILLSLSSTTIRKSLFGLRVVDQKTGQNIDVGKAIGRSLLYFISLLFFGVGFLMIIEDKKNRQGLHDKLAKTLVFRDKNKDLRPTIFTSIISALIILYANINGMPIVVHNSTCPPTITDIDGNTYKTVKIDTQCWMKENLKVTRDPLGVPITRYCYNNDSSICNTDGGLYTWDTAMDNSDEEGAQGICPDGWHIPTDSEWHILESGLAIGSCDANRGRSGGGCDPAGTKLKKGGSSGFDAIFAGYLNYSGAFVNLGAGTEFWTSFSSIKNPHYFSLFYFLTFGLSPFPLDPGSRAWSRYLDSTHSTIARNRDSLTASVRCIEAQALH